jgi:hypothetical protein
MLVTNATFDIPFGGTNPNWKLRIKVEGSDFLHRAAPIIAQVGTVPVEAIIVRLAGDGFMGLLAAVPADGETLKVGYLDTELLETGFAYDSTKVVV